MAKGTRTVTELQEIVDFFQGQLNDHYEAIVQQRIAIELLCESLGATDGPVARHFERALSDFISRGEPQLKNLNFLQAALNCLRRETVANAEESRGPRLRLVVDDPEE